MIFMNGIYCSKLFIFQNIEAAVLKQLYFKIFIAPLPRFDIACKIS